ncbi:MAG: PTS trehalose transporter subunit IIBC [Clostridium sp.]|uniref:PTS trehalose transporter subunit IIBC n=1 Tax=Clostridium sp. TaxID=1506 RepID=UPI0039ED0B83
MFTDNDAIKLLKEIGGKENILGVTHCVTRMRFVLKDENKANTEEIKKLKFVKGIFSKSGQYQVIIGTNVGDFYKIFAETTGIESGDKDEVKEIAKNNMKLYEKILSNISEIFVPLIPAIVAGGLILGFRSIIGDIKMFNGKSIADMSIFWAGVYSFLWLIGQAIFQFLPVGITWSVSKKMGATPILGIILGLTLISPQLMQSGLIGQKVPEVWNFGLFKIAKVGYQSQVVPAILAAMALATIEKKMKKITPNAISMIIVPFVTIIVSVILAHTIIGPVGRLIGDGIGYVIAASITGPYRVIFAAVFGFFYAPLVITGLHYINTAINLQLIANIKGTPIFPMVAISNIAQASATLAILIMNKTTAEREISVPATISGYLGVTEPALYGVNLRYKFPFICGMIGSSLAAVIITSGGTMANSIGVGGLPSILSIKPQYWGIYAIGMITAIVVPVILTTIVYKRKYKTGDSLKKDLDIPA